MHSLTCSRESVQGVSRKETGQVWLSLFDGLRKLHDGTIFPRHTRRGRSTASPKAKCYKSGHLPNDLSKLPGLLPPLARFRAYRSVIVIQPPLRCLSPTFPSTLVLEELFYFCPLRTHLRRIKNLYAKNISIYLMCRDMEAAAAAICILLYVLSNVGKGRVLLMITPAGGPSGGADNTQTR